MRPLTTATPTDSPRYVWLPRRYASQVKERTLCPPPNLTQPWGQRAFFSHKSVQPLVTKRAIPVQSTTRLVRHTLATLTMGTAGRLLGGVAVGGELAGTSGANEVEGSFFRSWLFFMRFRKALLTFFMLPWARC